MADRIFTYKQIPGKSIDTYWSLNDYIVQFEKSEHTKKLPGWQKNDDVSVIVDFYIKPEEIDEYIRPDRGASFFLQYHSKSEKEGTSIHGLICKEKFTIDKNQYSIKGTIPGEKIAGALEITLSLCLDEIITDSTIDEKEYMLLASDIGSTIYEDTRNVILEGEMSYFPVADIDFEKNGYPAKALYFLQKSKFTSLDSDFSTAYRLYFNNKHPQFTKINEIKETESQDYLLNMIVYDVYKQLIMNALDDETFTLPDEENPDNHTVRYVYARLINQLRKHHFSNASLETLREMAHSDDNTTQNRFLCALQSLLLTFGEK